MVDVKSKICEEEGCRKIACFGLSGHGVSHCLTHKQKNMMKQPNKKCIDKTCDELALFGQTFGGPRHCETHFHCNRKKPGGTRLCVLQPPQRS